MTPSSPDQSWERIGRAVRDAAPEVPEFTADERAACWHRIEASPARATSRRVGWKAAVAGVVAVATVGGAGAAATAEVFSARTGKGPVDAEDSELGGPGEKLNPAAPDFAQVIDQETADIRFPSAWSRDRSLSWENDNYSDDDFAGVSTGAIRLWMLATPSARGPMSGRWPCAPETEQRRRRLPG